MRKYHVMEMGQHNKRVIFLLAGWYNKLWMFWVFSKILSFNGFYCITYAYDGDIFSPNTEATTKHFNKIQDEILLKIIELKKRGYKDFSIFGTSLGSMLALMIADKSSDISKIILNTTGIDISEVVWGWVKVKIPFKKELLKQNLTLKQLKVLWNDITPASNINNLKNKKILVYLSKKDEIIPFNLGQRLVNEFENKRYNYTLVTNNKLNHLFTGTYNLFNAGRYLSFLKE